MSQPTKSARERWRENWKGLFADLWVLAGRYMQLGLRTTAPAGFVVGLVWGLITKGDIGSILLYAGAGWCAGQFLPFGLYFGIVLLILVGIPVGVTTLIIYIIYIIWKFFTK